MIIDEPHRGRAMELVVFTDGACTHNGKPYAIAAYAVVWPDHPDLDGGHKLPQGEAHTNNRAEYRALLYALIQADGLDPDRMQPLKVYTDSELMINSFTKWVNGWEKRNWKKSDGKPVLNLDLVQQIHDLLKLRTVHFHHVPAHTGKTDWASLYNNKVDELARKATLGISIR